MRHPFFREITPMSQIKLLALTLSLTMAVAWAQPATAPGQAEFERNCGICHGGDGMGGEMGPGIANRMANISDQQLATILHDGRPERGMPAFPNTSAAENTQMMT